MSVWERYWDVWFYFLLWIGFSVLFERLQRRSYLKRGKRDDRP